MSRAKLPSSLLWQEDGSPSRHLTEEALAALADGEESLLPDDVIAHAASCEDCARGMGEAAMLAASVTSALLPVTAHVTAGAGSGASVAPASQRVAPPFWALVFGLGFAGIGALPFLMGVAGFPGWLLRAAVILKRALPVFAHSAISLAGSDAIAAERMGVTLASLAVLVMSLFAVSRLTPREGIAG